MKTNQLLAVLILGGVVAYVAMNQRAVPTYQPAPAPQLPPTGNSKRVQFLQWAGLIISLFGKAKWLWEEGGPFHKKGIPEPGAPGDGQFWDEVATVA